MSENEVRLFDATRYRSAEIKLPSMPSGLKETVAVGGPEKQQQRYGGANGSATFFGSGSGGDSEKHTHDLKQYFDRVDSALTPYMNQHPAPVVLAGVEHLLPIYRTANTCATILDGEVHGNQDRATPDEIHSQAWEVAAPHFAEAETTAKDRFHQFLGTGIASTEAKDIEVAAEAGRVATLFVALAQGNSQGTSRAAIATLAKGGDIYALSPESMPTDQPLAAIFRY